MNIYMICTLWTPFQAERDWKNSYREILLIPLYIFYSLWSQLNPKKFSIILRSQFNYHTVPVTTFNISGNVFIQKRHSTFWKCQDWENFVVIVLGIRHGKVDKLIQSSKTNFKSSCYCHISWDTLYIMRVRLSLKHWFYTISIKEKSFATNIIFLSHYLCNLMMFIFDILHLDYLI